MSSSRRQNPSDIENDYTPEDPDSDLEDDVFEEDIRSNLETNKPKQIRTTANTDDSQTTTVENHPPNLIQVENIIHKQIERIFLRSKTSYDKNIFKKPSIPIWRKKKVVIGEKNIAEYHQKKFKLTFMHYGYPERLIARKMVVYAIHRFTQIQISQQNNNKAKRNQMKICPLCNWPRSWASIVRNLILCDNCAVRQGFLIKDPIVPLNKKMFFFQ